MKNYLSIITISFCVLIIYACSKELKSNLPISKNTNEKSIILIKKWLAKNGQIYRQGNILVITGLDKENILGKLDWNNVREFIVNGVNYFDVPFLFVEDNSVSSYLLTNKNTNIPPTIFSLLFKLTDSSIDVRLKTFAPHHEIQKGNIKMEGTSENYFFLNGQWSNSYFWENDSILKECSISTKPIQLGSSNSFVASTCQTFTTTMYTQECWQNPGGGAYDVICSATPTTTYYTICNDGSTSSGGSGSFPSGSTGGGSPAPAPSPTPIFKAPIEQNVHLCGKYNWKSVGAAYYTQFTNLSFLLVHTGSNPSISSISLGGACVSLAKSQVFNSTDGANNAWNDVWNRSIDRVIQEVNNGTTAPGDFYVSQRMKELLSLNLSIYYLGSTFNAGGCIGTIPYSQPGWCNNSNIQ